MAHLLADAAQALEEALQLAVERDNWDRKGKLYVSDLKHALPPKEGGDCKRKLWAKLNDEPQKPSTPGVDLMLHAGDRLHDAVAQWLQHHLGDEWQIITIEGRAYDDIEPLRGRLDIEILHKETGERLVVDVKTKRGASFRYMLDGPKEADKLQVQAYIKSRKASGGLLLYIDREGQNWIKIFPVPRDDAAVDRAIEELLRIRDSNLEDLPPLEPEVVRSKNKGPDSLKVRWPWQVEWCPLEDCHCSGRAKNKIPRGIVGYVDNDGNVEMKEGYEYMQDWIEKKLNENV